MEKVLISLQKNFPKNEYRISPRTGSLQKKAEKRWRTACEHGNRKDQCVKCGNVKKCEHGKQPTYCKLCGGGSLCKHDKVRSKCKVCGNGAPFCEHGREKHDCKECGGKGICVHGKRKRNCVDCDGSSICEHKKIKSFCRDCDGSAFCVHNITRTTCRKCGGGSFCKHDKIRSQCKLCGGGSICEHKCLRSQCVTCGGGSICDHGIRRVRCRECKGVSICVHGKLKYSCKQCGGKGVCACGEYVKQGGNGMCNHCNPDFVYCEPKCSKIACKFMDELEKELKFTIQHKHLDLVKKEWVGEEHRVLNYQDKCVDGYYVENDKETIIEFLGDYYHGHPSRWGEDEENRDYYSRLFKDLFYNTERILLKLKILGYRVLYVWEKDYKNKKPFDSLMSIVKEFDNKLMF